MNKDARPSFTSAICNEILGEIASASRRTMPRLAYRSLLKYRLLGRSFEAAFDAHGLRDVPMPISADEGAFLYQITRARRAKLVVEFGTSFGASAIYIAAALRDQGSGRFIGTEIEPDKVARARGNLARAGFSEVAEIREGNALDTLAGMGGPIDILFLDGWKNLYLPIVRMLLPNLPAGSIVVADNMNRFRRELEPFRDFLRGHFCTSTLPIGDGLEFAIRLGDSVAARQEAPATGANSDPVQAATSLDRRRGLAPVEAA